MNKSASSQRRQIDAVIFDVDGTILDSESIFLQAMKDITGYELDLETRLHIMGRKGTELGKYILDHYGINEDPVDFMRRFDDHLNTLLPAADTLPGAENLIRMLKNLGIPLAIATGSTSENLKAKTARHQELFGLFDVVVCGNEVAKGKPHPEMFLTAMERLGMSDPEKILVFEDAASGVKCANNCNMPVVMVPDYLLPFDSQLHVLEAKPTLIMRSLESFKWDLFAETILPGISN